MSLLGEVWEALAWALEQECSILLIQEHRTLGNVMKGATGQANVERLDGRVG